MNITFNQLKTFYNALKNKMKGFRGNWNQNDPTADDYIKNRPFYSEGMKEVEILPETTVFVEEAHCELYQPFSIKLQNGLTYIVTFDSVTYRCVAKEIYENEPFIGNSSILGWNDNVNTGEPFFIDVWYDNNETELTFATTTAGEHTISIIEISEIIHKINPKYVPLPEGAVNEKDLSSVAWTGSYNDLNDKPLVVQADISQSLTVSQKDTARQNIGAASANDASIVVDSNAVKYSTKQSLTDGQKAIARDNIGAGTSNYDDLENRPVYQTQIPRFVYLDRTNLSSTGTELNQNNAITYEYPYYASDIDGSQLAPVVGDICEIKINEQTFEAKYTHEPSEHYGGFGNRWLSDRKKSNTGEPFYIYVIPGSTNKFSDYKLFLSTNPTITSFSIARKAFTEYHQLDENYIPDSIARVSDLQDILPEATIVDNGKVLGIANGKWTKVAMNEGVSQEYVDNAIAGITDWTTGADEDISNLLERTEAIETDVETIKQGYVTVGYVNEKTQNIPAIKEDIETLKTDAETFKEYFEVINTSYATKKYVDDAVASSGGGTGGVSSWNDLTDKPFGTEEAWQELMSNSVCTFTRNADMGNACVYITTLTTEMLEKFKGDWNKAFVVWDEVEYECNPKLAFGATKGIGNVGFFDGTEDSGEPFLIMVDDGTNTGGSPVAIIISVEDSKNAIETATHSVGISLMVETIHPIDTKFIDNISWNKISDKPFYDEGTKTVTLDYANPPAVRVDLMGDPLYKVTDDILTEADINSANISLSGTIGGIDTNFSQELNVDTATVAYTFTFGAIYEFDYEVNGTTVAIMIAVATQTGEFEEMGISVNIAETGTYIDCSFISGEGTINSISLEYGDDLKTLEAKYLDIINCEPDKILVTQQQLTFTGDEADGFYIDINGISFIEGKTYKVIWDGTEYTYNAFNNGNVVAIGDTNTLLAWNEDTGIRIWTADSSPSHTVTITKVESCEIKEEYLPDSLYTYIDNAVGEVDLSDYAKLEDINNKADKSEIPTKVSQLINDSGYISEHQSLEGFATEPYVDYQVARIEGNLSSEIAVERARINTFTALEDGSTTGDAELQDIRVGADGTVYESAGASVRGQINQINDVVFYDEIEKDITDTLTIENGYYYTKGFTKVAQNGLGCTNIIPVKSGDKFKISAKYGYYAVLVAEFDTSNTMISYTGQVDGKEAVATDYEYTVPNGVSGIAVSTRDTKYNPIKVIKIAKENVKNRIKTLEDLSELSLVATNQVVDKSEWTATGGALTFEGDTAIVTADKSNVRVGVNAKFGECKNGDTLFFKANIKAPWGVGGTEQQNKPEIIMWVNASTGLKDVTRCILPNIEQNDYYGNIAFDCDVNGTPLLCSVLYNNVNVIPTNAQIEVKDIVVVNLTKVFGAGNEPTAEEFYSLLNCFENKYFEGEKNLFSASANLRRIYNDYKSTLLTEDITVTVGANGDFETLNGAISYLSSFYPAYKKGGIKCYIKILEGTVINEQIFANQIDLQYITIIAEGNTETISIDGTSYTMNIVDVNATGFKHTANAHDARGNYPFIAGENAAKLPTIGCVFRLMPETVEDGKTVCGMLCNRGSEGVVLAASGFDGFNDGVIANNESSITIREGISRNMTRWGVHARHNGEVSARSCVCTNCGIGACADRVADCDVREAVLNGSKVAIECNNISRVNANGCHAQNCGTNGGYVVMISGGGFANCGSLDTTGYVGTLYNKATNTLSSSGIIFV